MHVLRSRQTVAVGRTDIHISDKLPTASLSSGSSKHYVGLGVIKSLEAAFCQNFNSTLRVPTYIMPLARAERLIKDPSLNIDYSRVDL
jgi:hypothetical protein